MGRTRSEHDIRDLPLTAAELTRLRMTLGRLGRLLRQQNDEGLSYALISLLLNIARSQPVTAGELAATEGVTPPSVTRSLNRLLELGYVSREPDPRDGRAYVIRLTASGAAHRQQLLRSREVWLTEHLKRLSAEDSRALIAALPALERLCEPEVLSDVS
jgi:DNA-binding MarR family transcriptional regulator